jgi:hypothetical protein
MPRPQLQRLQILLVATIALCTGSTAARADEKSLDNFLQQAWKDQQVQPAAKCSDEVFGRRIYLDLVGRIPSTTELAAFKADGRDDRRLQLIDVLLASEDYVQHFADIFDTLLMGRTTDRNYDERHKHEWRSYLERVFRDNRRWDDVVSEILLARPATNNDRGAVWFLFERNNKHQEIAEAVAPAFFGIHIECAQCHDHMIATEI